MSENLSFALVQLRSDLTPATAPDPIVATDLGPTTDIANRALAVIVGDGDRRLETGETGHVLGAAAGSNTALLAGLNGAEDPVRITTHGRIDAGNVGALGDGSVGFANASGFGVRGGGELSSRNVNFGESLTFALNPRGGVVRELRAISFVADVGTGTSPVEIALDVDGDVLASGAYARSSNAANIDVALRFTAAPGATVVIDLVAASVAVNGVALSEVQTAAFFAAFRASAGDKITIGSVGLSFAVSGLTIETDVAGPPENRPPSVTLTNQLATVSEDAVQSAPLKVADIVVADDGLGVNTLALTGADAGLFEIVGNGLFLKVGAALDFRTNPTLDVIVTVDDPTVGGAPDAQSALALSVTPEGSLYSFARVQLQPGITPATASEPLTSAAIGGTTSLSSRAVIVVRGDGDRALEAGELGYVLGAAAVSNGISGLATLNGANDPVRLSAHGRIDAATVGAVSGDSIGFAPDRGFGLRNGTEVATGLLNSGDSLTWRLNPVGGAAQALRGASFVVERLTATTAAEVALDIDGDVLADGAYAAAQNGANIDAALRFSAGPGALVEIDFLARTLSVAGALRSGASVDAFFAAFAASAGDAITIGAIGGSGFAVRDLQLSAGQAAAQNLPPSVSLANVLAGVAENADLSARLRVADIVVSDDPLGRNDLALTGADAALFEIVGDGLFLRAGAALDFETRPTLAVGVSVDDPTVGGAPDGQAALSLAVTDAPEVYGDRIIDGSLADWAGATPLGTGVVDGVTYSILGDWRDGATVFALRAEGGAIGPNTTVWLNTDLDVATGYRVFGFAVGAEFNVNIGADGKPALFTGAAGETPVVAALDHAYSADRSVLEFAAPSALLGGATLARVFADVNDAAFLPGDYGLSGYLVGRNDPPSVTLTPLVTTASENLRLVAPLRVADIVVRDEGLGVNALALTGADAALFEIVSDGLFLKAGVTLDAAANPSLDVTVTVDDAAVGAAPDDAAAFALTVEPGGGSFGSKTIDGALSDWTAAERLDTVWLDGAAGQAVYGAYAAEAFVIAIQSDVVIGPGTTLWLNTDLDRDTGYQIFGLTGGAEFNIEIGADFRPALYTGAAGETPFADLSAYRFSADGKTLELAFRSDLLTGDPRRAELFVDINNTTFLPNDYDSFSYLVGEAGPRLPQDPTRRIAIVYSETTAEYYFDKTAYGQLFMAAQGQAMQAGVPFDVIGEAELADLGRLVDYDAIVFPAMSHVRSADLATIAQNLVTASQSYGVGLIAMGNFLTNDETGAAITGDSYARMKRLFGVTLDGFGQTEGVRLEASDAGHPVSDRYAPGELVGQYNNNSYLYFRDISGEGRTLFTQTVDDPDPAIGPVEHAAVIATERGGRNVHFATDAVFGNNNILSEAIGWAASTAAPEVRLQTTRFESLFFSRNDMDQSQYIFEVDTLDPGIYDLMLPIVEQWYQDYGFVGSYYVNIGAYSPDERTNWAVSRPYYEALMALESEIGTHSYTHPSDTNLLLPDQIEQALLDARVLAYSAVVNHGVVCWCPYCVREDAAKDVLEALAAMDATEINAMLADTLARTDPRSPTAIDAALLTPVERAVLEASYRFQFEYSKLIIERELGITVTGGAVPGAPEKLEASLEIIQYLDYMSGGFSGPGAGYPGAFGFLTPAHADKVYFAPNVSFDFSLIGFRNLTPAQSEAVWAEEYAAIVNKGSTPIIHWPWHDYGPTEWRFPDSPPSEYTLEMFTNFIARAAADGTEFVTGADLAQRILSFTASDIEIRQDGERTVATVTGSDVGRFALETEGPQGIASVANWYAWDGDTVFLPRAGGVFDIAFGAAPADVTRIAALPMRAELVSATGDGADLDFAMVGRGEVAIELQAWGDRGVVASGADAVRLDGERLTLVFDTVANHAATIDYRDGVRLVGDAADSFLIGGDGAMTLDGGAGDDTLFGGGGGDTFVYVVGAGSADVVLDFAADDSIALVGSGFVDASAARAAFLTDGDDLLLTLSDGAGLRLSGTAASGLTVAQILLFDEAIA